VFQLCWTTGLVPSSVRSIQPKMSEDSPMKKIIVLTSTIASLLSGGLVIGLVQTPVHSEPLVVAQSDDQYLQEVNTLLRENREIARSIATKLGIESSSTTPGSGNLPEQNNALIIRNQSLFRQIAAKMGIETVTSVPIDGTLIEQNHMLLRQNRAIVMDIMDALGLEMSGGLPSNGSLVQQNRDLLMGNRTSLQAIAAKLGV
jgi:hypothetical protein